MRLEFPVWKSIIKKVSNTKQIMAGVLNISFKSEKKKTGFTYPYDTP